LIEVRDDNSGYDEADDRRALGHLEQLVDRLPRLLDEIPELPQTLKLCRQAVQQAKAGWS
jgi:hypothetical protein